MKRRRIGVLFVVLFFARESLVWAGNKVAEGLTAESNNGKYSATARAPSIDSQNYTIVLQEVPAWKELWTWVWPARESWPDELIPADDGTLIVRSSLDEYYVFDTSGKRVKAMAALEQFSVEEQGRYMDRKTNGTVWNQFSKQGFLTDSGRSLFYVRTYWGHFLVIDIHAGTHLRDDALDLRLKDHVDSEIRAWLATFDHVFAGPCPDCGTTHLKGNVLENAFVIRHDDLKEGEPVVAQTLRLTEDPSYPEFKRLLDRLDGGRSELAVVPWTLIAVLGVSAFLGAVAFVLRLRRRPRAA